MSILTILGYLISATSIFGALLYYIGRQYAEAYYRVLGIPSTSLTFSVPDYMYQAVSSWEFLVAAAITWLIFILWRFRRLPGDEKSADDPYKQVSLLKIIRDTILWKKGIPQFFALGFYFYLIALAVPIVAFILMFAEKNYPAQSVAQIMITLLTAWFAYNIMTDAPSRAFIISRNRLYYTFIVATLAIIILTFQWLPTSSGIFWGINDGSVKNAERIFPTVYLTTSIYPRLSNIEWSKANDGSFYNKEPLLLLLTTQNDIFLRRLSDKNAFSILRSNILEIRFQIPGR